MPFPIALLLYSPSLHVPVQSLLYAYIRYTKVLLYLFFL